MPIPTRSRSLRQPGFTQRDSRTFNDVGSTSSNIANDDFSTLSSTTRVTHVSERSRTETPLSDIRRGVAHEATGINALACAPASAPALESTQQLDSRARGPSGEGDSHMLSNKTLSSPPRIATTYKNTPSHLRLPSPIKAPTRIPSREEIREIATTGVSSESRDTDIAMASKSHISRSSSLRQPSSRAALGQSRASQGHGKSSSVSQTTSRNSALRSVAESSHLKVYLSERKTVSAEATGSTYETANRAPYAINQQSKLSSTRDAGSTSSELPQWIPSNPHQSGTRPEFSTYKQHFTPKKAPKAPARSPIDSSREVESGDYTTSEVLHLRDELLQLSLLYISGQAAKKKWERDTKRKLEKKFRHISQRSHEHAFAQQIHQTQLNLEALEHWLNDGESLPTDKVKSLSQCIRDVTNQMSPDGKFERVIRRFCNWYDLVAISIDMEDGQALALTDPLDAEWKNDAKAALRAMETCKKQLLTIGRPNTTAAVGKAFEYHNTIVIHSIEELHLMLDINDLVLEQTNKHKKDVIDEDLKIADKGPTIEETPRKGIWNRM